MRIWHLVLHGVQRLTVGSKISLLILACALFLHVYHSDNRIPDAPFLPENSRRVLLTKALNSLKILCVCTATNARDFCIDHYRETWGRRCTRWVNAYEDPGKAYEVSASPKSPDLNVSYTLLKPIYPWLLDEFHSENYDWVLRVRDNTYVIMENLRVFLGQYNSSEPFLFGYETGNNFVHDKAYAFSFGALRKLVEVMRPSAELTTESTTCLTEELAKSSKKLGEHYLVATCFRAASVTPSDSRDHLGRERFLLPFLLWDLFIEGAAINKTNQIKHVSKTAYIDGPECCSDTAVAFHTGGHHGFPLAYEYFLYRLRPLGIKFTQTIPENEHLAKLLKKSQVFDSCPHV